jgi:formate/nitrite transporter FocA (FNT family)
MLALYATIQALAVTTITKAASNQLRVLISAMRSGLLVSCKFAIETSMTNEEISTRIENG